MSNLIRFVIGIAIIGVCYLLLDWMMREFGIGRPVSSIIWIGFVIMALLAMLGLFNYGPFRTAWGRTLDNSR